eukprot:gnl/MRDRNA2_/MRDRNA2_223510_c0_seq1.p1 gnl/MRDRNA2_/MRDRNA2_223510_c0~~gnl/MRDRNA2_/MRDRNA2_223510_c0_seq1.p1  ORF type:complete len:295 (-),score=20.63 gnl/MRDRNA2_/MRDRNA2_223510_c0_seq1:61-945(-)
MLCRFLLFFSLWMPSLVMSYREGQNVQGWIGQTPTAVTASKVSHNHLKSTLTVASDDFGSQNPEDQACQDVQGTSSVAETLAASQVLQKDPAVEDYSVEWGGYCALNSHCVNSRFFVHMSVRNLLVGEPTNTELLSRLFNAIKTQVSADIYKSGACKSKQCPDINRSTIVMHFLGAGVANAWTDQEYQYVDFEAEVQAKDTLQAKAIIKELYEVDESQGAPEPIKESMRAKLQEVIGEHAKRLTISDYWAYDHLQCTRNKCLRKSRVGYNQACKDKSECNPPYDCIDEVCKTND